MLFLWLFAWVNLIVRQRMNSTARIIYSMHSGMLSITLSSVELADFEYVFISWQLGLYANFALVCTSQINRTIFFFKKRQPDLQWDSWPGESDTRGNAGGREKAALDGNGGTSSCLKACRSVLRVPCLTSPWGLHLLEDGAKPPPPALRSVSQHSVWHKECSGLLYPALL